MAGAFKETVTNLARAGLCVCFVTPMLITLRAKLGCQPDDRQTAGGAAAAARPSLPPHLPVPARAAGDADLDAARRALGGGDLVTANEALTRLVARHPDVAATYVLRGTVLLANGRAADAAADADRAIRLAQHDPLAAQAYVLRGWAGFAGRGTPPTTPGRPDAVAAALADFLAAVDLRPGPPVSGEAHAGAAVMLAYQGRAGEALDHIATAHRLAPADPTVARWHRAMPTIVYWREPHRRLGGVLDELAAVPDVNGRVAACRRAAAAVAGIDAAIGVDPDAVRVGAAWAGWLGRMADHAAYTNDPARLVEAFIRGADGDPLGTAADLGRAAASVDREQEAVLRSTELTRAALTARYGIKF